MRCAEVDRICVEEAVSRQTNREPGAGALYVEREESVKDYILTQYRIMSGHTASADDDQYCKSEGTAYEHTLVMLRPLSSYTASLHAEICRNDSRLVIANTKIELIHLPNVVLVSW